MSITKGIEMNKLEKYIFVFYLLGMFTIFLSISLSQGFFLLSLGAFLFWLAQKLIAPKENKQKILLPVTFLLAVGMYVWSGISDIVNGDGKLALLLERDIWLYFPVLMIPNIAQTKEDIKKIFQWIAWAAIVFGFLGVIEFVSAVSLKTLLTKGKIVHLPRLYGGAEVSLFTGLTLTYAALYFFPASFFLYRLAESFQKSYREYFSQFFYKQNIFLVVGLILSVFNIIATGRRSALLGILIVFPLVWWFKAKKKTPILFFVTIILLLFSFNEGLRSRIINPFSGQELSTNYRIVMYKASLASSLEKPFFGVGTNNFAKLLEEKKALDVDGNILVFGHSHNDFLDRLATGGFPAMLFLIAIFVYMIIKMRTISQEKDGSVDSRFSSIADMVVIVLLVFAIASQFQCYLTDDENLIFFTAALGIGEFLIAQKKPLKPKLNDK